MSLSKPVSSFYIFKFAPDQKVDIDDFCEKIKQEEICSIDGKSTIESLNFVSPSDIYKKGMISEGEILLLNIRHDKKSLSKFKVDREIRRIVSEEYSVFASVEDFMQSAHHAERQKVKSEARAIIAKETSVRENKVTVLINFKSKRLYIDKGAAAKSAVELISEVTNVGFEEFCPFPEELFEENKTMRGDDVNSLFFNWVYAHANKVKNVPKAKVSLGNNIAFDDKANKVTATGSLYLFFDNFKKMRDKKQITKIELAIKELVEDEDGTKSEDNVILYTLNVKDYSVQNFYSSNILHPKYCHVTDFISSQIEAFEELEDHLLDLGDQFFEVLKKHGEHGVLKWVSAKE